ncbi:MAG: molybdopterin-dependent oxidoreductase [Betaproteobacteria bacterium]|nr:molybdopterin-dependent oxidoreductase [Betaproteobacteria bacterium]
MREAGTSEGFDASRRAFLLKGAAVGGALVIGVGTGHGAAADAGVARDGGAGITQWVVVEPDDTVTVRIARSELGQGSFTGLAQLVCEELECDWRNVRAEYADVNEHMRRDCLWGSMVTGGSRSIRESQEMLRKAGAAARQMLVAAAAARWGVPPVECGASQGVITHAASGRTLTFGAVAAEAARREIPGQVALKGPKDWRLIGSPVPRFDIPDKTTGRQIYAADVRLPGLLHASIVQVPVFGGRLKSADVSAVSGTRGVRKVVVGDDFVAVVADNWWRANRAVRALPVEWDAGEHAAVTSDAIRARLRTGLDAADVPVARRDGEAEAVLASAPMVLEAEYHAPYLAHATLEPQTATALWQDGHLQVWVGTQNGEASIRAAAEEAGLPLERVNVHKLHAGGGFGRRGAHQDYTRQAVRLAMELPGTPVRLQWSREEDIRHDRYRPVESVRLRGALDEAGNWIAWQVRQAEQSILASVRPAAVRGGIDPVGVRAFADNPYDVPNFTNTYAMHDSHVPPGFWRAVAHTHNPYFRECFIDELCRLAGRDPVEFRRPLLAKSPKDLAVLEAAAKAVGWNDAAPEGVHRGIAVADAYGSFTAAAVELSVREERIVDVRRVVVALDCGHVVNPDAVIAQVEGGVAWALGMAMHEEITIRAGHVEQSNFTDYPVLRMHEMTARVEALLVPSGGFWGGVGEPPLAAVPAALCNALFAATGRRVRSLPLKRHGFSFA